MCRILLIEDDPDVREATTVMFERAGYDVYALPNGDGAVEMCRENDIDIVVTDVVMPHQEGIATIRLLRKKLPGIKIIAISGGGQYGSSKDYLTAAKKLGADRVFAKPIDLGTVEAAIRDLTGTLSDRSP